jgi:hypothetical protein
MPAIELRSARPILSSWDDEGDVMDVRVLGHVEAGNGARTYALGEPTQRRVFAALVARRREVVDVSALVEICSPKMAPSSSDRTRRRWSR